MAHAAELTSANKRLEEADFQLIHAEQRLRQLEHEAALRGGRDEAAAATAAALERQLSAARSDCEQRCARLGADGSRWKDECRDSQRMVGKLRGLLQELKGEYQMLQHQQRDGGQGQALPGSGGFGGFGGGGSSAELDMLRVELRECRDEAERALVSERRQSAYWRAAAEEQERLRAEMEGAIRAEVSHATSCQERVESV